MDYRKKLNKRLYFGIGYIVIGITMILLTFIVKTKNDYVSTLGLIIALMGLVRIRNYFLITKSEERVEKQEILETDERNVSLSIKARASTFNLTIILSSVTVVALTLLGQYGEAKILSYLVSTMVLIYWICYFIYHKRG